MPGIKITRKQSVIYMHNRKNGNTQILAAAKAGISERSGRTIEHNKHWTQRDERRSWRTRKDPFEAVWDKDIVPMLQQGLFEATFILEELQKKYPDQFSQSVLRTLQRKIKRWHALFGKDKEVMFRQENEPGKLGISDFTHPDDIKVTINGNPFEHIFYHFRLPYSNHNYMQVFAGSGEPFDAFAQGLQEALQDLGGAPETHRTDSLSASYKNLTKEAADDQTERYKAFVEHYGMTAKRINPGKSNENGAIEASHRHIKNRIRQSLIVRSNADFTSLKEYRSFIQEVTKEHNKRNSKNIEIEKKGLMPLPSAKAVTYTDMVAVVSSTSTIEVKRVTYTVPSKLIGTTLSVRIYNDTLECYLGTTHALTLARAQNPTKGKRARVVDYRHIIDSLVKKPGAFYGSRMRNDILPNDNYRYIWQHISSTMNIREANKFIVGILHIAATYDCQEELSQEIITLIADNKQPILIELQNKFKKHAQVIPAVKVLQHTIGDYNKFIPSHQGMYQ